MKAFRYQALHKDKALRFNFTPCGCHRAGCGDRDQAIAELHRRILALALCIASLHSLLTFTYFTPPDCTITSIVSIAQTIHLHHGRPSTTTKGV